MKVMIEGLAIDGPRLTLTGTGYMVVKRNELVHYGASAQDDTTIAVKFSVEVPDTLTNREIYRIGRELELDLKSVRH